MGIRKFTMLYYSYMTICIGSQSEELKDHLMKEIDYTLLPELAWTLLVIWYGLSAESRPIARYTSVYNVVYHYDLLDV